MRILALATEAFGGSGGIAQANRDLFEAIGKWHEVDILPRHGKESRAGLLPGNVTQSRPVPERIGYAAQAFQKMLTRPGYDAIFCGHLFMAPLAWILSKIFGKPIWLQLYGIEAWDKPSKAIRRTVEDAHLVTAISRYTRRCFLNWALSAPERVKILPVTFSKEFTPGPASAALIEKYGLKNKRIILTVSRLASTERYKGQDKVIRALPKILERSPEAVYVIAGKGDDQKRLKALAAECGVEASVLFVGEVPAKDLPDLYRSADVYAMPSTGEGFGIVFLEAAACGLPVIGCGRDGSADALRENLLGTTVNPENPAELVQAIAHSLNERFAPPQKEIQKFSKTRFETHVLSLLRDLNPKVISKR